VIVVADAGPIHYLIMIEAIDVLCPLDDRVLVPQTVAEELKKGGAPEAVRTWMARPPLLAEEGNVLTERFTRP
jgi:predicted nucleic acid-binding protein